MCCEGRPLASEPLILFAATRNQAKVAELRRLFDGFATVEPIAIALDVPEGNESIEANATAKAEFASQASGCHAAVASDGGLIVPALGKRWNPDETKRFAPGAVDDAGRARALLELASQLRGDERRISWRESVAIAVDGRRQTAWTAESRDGLLAESLDVERVARGHGFWIPAIWHCPELGGRLLSDLIPAERATREDHWRRLRVLIERDWPLVSQRLRRAS